MTEPDPIVTINDVRRAGYCPSGARRWAEMHGIDFRDFLKNGIAASRLLETGEPMAIRAVETATRQETE